MYLPFRRCLRRLEHSFLRIDRAYTSSHISFQHPSLRDMLLTILQNNPKVRHQYIIHASPDGLSSLIRGIPLFGQIPEDEAHMPILGSEDELNMLCKRIEIVVTETIPHSKMEKILSSADVLIPRKGFRKIGPAELDLVKFSKTPPGRVLEATLNAIAEQETYNNNATYSLLSWASILQKFYSLVPYVLPIPRPTYLRLLVDRIENADTYHAISLAGCLSAHEPLIFKQVFSHELDRKWNDFIISRLRECCKQSEDIEDISYMHYDSYEDYEIGLSAYDEWHDEADELLQLADTFYSFSGLQEANEFSDLQELFDTLESPSEPLEVPYEDYEAHHVCKDYWTIERLFEDL